jgi:hypothetical protein
MPTTNAVDAGYLARPYGLAEPAALADYYADSWKHAQKLEQSHNQPLPPQKKRLKGG